MPSLSDKLHSLGVKIGTQNLPPAKPKIRAEHPIEGVLPGDWWSTKQGDVFFVETRYQNDFQVGKVILKPSSPFNIIAAWAGEPRLAHLDLDQFAFIDTETTGLSSGSGTFAFLIGIGRFEGDDFHLVQFFLHDPAQETAQLAALEEFLAPCEAIVSFNGKAFDLPIIKTRYITNGWPPPLEDAPHLDLLHLARRLWKPRLPNRALGELEANILGTKRAEIDVPGWMIPELYFDYLHTGDARPLRSVFYHNEVDIVSLAALLSHIADLVADPLNKPIDHSLDILAIGKLYADLGFLDIAAQIYQRGLNQGDIEEEAYWVALRQLSFIHKKRGDIPNAILQWEQAAQEGHIYAQVELAKKFEHQDRDFQAALHWTEKALETLSYNASPLDHVQWYEALIHRKNRLENKIARQS